MAKVEVVAILAVNDAIELRLHLVPIEESMPGSHTRWPIDDDG